METRTIGHRGVEREEVRAFLASVEKTFPLTAAFLVGSRRHGRELLESDYDIVLVSDRFAGIEWTDRMRAVWPCWPLPVGLDAFCYTPREFAHMKVRLCSVADAMQDPLDLLPWVRP